MKRTLVSIRWLKDHINDLNLILIDASQSFKPPVDKTLEGKQIRGSRSFNLKANFSDKESKYPNMLCSPVQFQAEARKLGINNDSVLVVYDNQGVCFSPRVWWMFTIMGNKNVLVLSS